MIRMKEAGPPPVWHWREWVQPNKEKVPSIVVREFVGTRVDLKNHIRQEIHTAASDSDIGKLMSFALMSIEGLIEKEETI